MDITKQTDASTLEARYRKACAKVNELKRQLAEAEQEQWNAYVATKAYRLAEQRRQDIQHYWNDEL